MKTFFLLLFLSLSLVSCSSIKEAIKPKPLHEEVHKNHLPLAKQRLIVRPGRIGLTNQVCTKWDSEKCLSKSVMVYDLRDPEIRKTLISFGFACRVGSKRYRICDDKPGLCRNEGGCVKKKKHLITRKEYCAEEGIVKTDYLPIEEKLEYLMDGGTECRQGM